MQPLIVVVFVCENFYFGVYYLQGAPESRQFSAECHDVARAVCVFEVLYASEPRTCDRSGLVFDCHDESPTLAGDCLHAHDFANCGDFPVQWQVCDSDFGGSIYVPIGQIQ